MGLIGKQKKEVFTGQRVYVQFNIPLGNKLVKDLEDIESTVIDAYTNTQVYKVGKTVPIIYNKPMGDRINNTNKSVS